MKSIRQLSIVVACIGSTLASALAQEVLSREEAMKFAFLVAQHEPSASQIPILVDSDLKRAFGAHEDEYGALVLPETKLSPATFESAAGRDVLPVGQLWLRKLTPQVDGSGVESSALTMVSIPLEGESHRVPLCLLGARKTAAGGWELLVFGKAKEPLLKVPMTARTSAQSLPVELRGERESDGGKLTVRLVGRFEATIPVTELAD